jgi:hypothetical protein
VNARDKTGETALFHAARGLFRAQNAQKRAKNTENGHKNTENGKKSTENDKKHAENGEKRGENGEKSVENGDLRLFSAQDGDFVSLFPADFSEIARILVENGAVLEMAGRNGLTAAEIAAGKGGKWCVFWGFLGSEMGVLGSEMVFWRVFELKMGVLECFWVKNGVFEVKMGVFELKCVFLGRKWVF